MATSTHWRPLQRQQLLILCLLAAAAVVLTTPKPAAACTSVIVGRAATADGSTIIARTDDGEDAVSPQERHSQPGSARPWTFASINGLRYTFANGSLAYTAMPCPDSLAPGSPNPSSEVTGVNSAGLAISATETIHNKDAALAADPYVTDAGVSEDSVTSLLLASATSARLAVELLGALLSERGAAEGMGVLVSDRQGEAWYLETGSGHHWLAQRIPDAALFVSANQGRYKTLPTSGSSGDVMMSAGLVEFAKRHQLYNPAAGPFSFFDAFHEDGPTDLNYNAPRINALQRRLAGVDAPLPRSAADAAAAPVFVTPQKKVRVRDVVAAFREHYVNTPQDPYAGILQDPRRPVTVLRASLGHITVQRPWLPPGIATVEYMAQAMTGLSPFIPLHAGLRRPPKALTNVSSEIDGHSLFWAARRLQAAVFQDFARLAPPAVKAIEAFEARLAITQAVVEANYARAVLRGAGRSAERLLQRFADRAVDDAVDLLRRLADIAAMAAGLGRHVEDHQYRALVVQALCRHFLGPPDEDPPPECAGVGFGVGVGDAAVSAVQQSQAELLRGGGAGAAAVYVQE